MKKVLVTLLIVLMTVGALFAAGAKEDVAPKRTLRISAESWMISKIYLEDAARIFMEKHPNVDVEIITMADQNVATAYVVDWSKGNTVTDLVFLDGGYLAKAYQAQDLIYDFDKDLNFFADFPASNYRPGALETGVFDGVQVCVPSIYEVYAVSINTQMFKEAGLVDAAGNPLPMRNWDDFYNFAEKLTKKDARGTVTQVGASIQWGNNLASILQGAIIGQFGHLYAADGITYDFDNKEFRDIVALWQKGVQNGYISTSTFVDNAGGRNGFKAGQIAMCYEAAGRWMEALETIGEENLSVVDIPGGRGTLCFGCQMVIPRASENADLAVAFIKDGVYSEFVQTNTFTVFGKMSVIKEHFDKALQETPLWNNIAGSMANAIPIPQYEEQNKWLSGLNVIFHEGLVDPRTSADDIVKKVVALAASIKK